jgi:hypothetical protein
LADDVVLIGLAKKRQKSGQHPKADQAIIPANPAVYQGSRGPEQRHPEGQAQENRQENGERKNFGN